MFSRTSAGRLVKKSNFWGTIGFSEHDSDEDDVLVCSGGFRREAGSCDAVDEVVAATLDIITLAIRADSPTPRVAVI